MNKTYPLYTKKSTTIIILHILVVISFSIQSFYEVSRGHYLIALLPAAIVIATLISAYLTIYSKGPLTPRIEINDEHILYRPSAFSGSIRHRWKEISSIKVSELALTILTNSNKTEYLHFEEYRNIERSFVKVLKDLSERNDVQVNL
jgi:hypothetical protein